MALARQPAAEDLLGAADRLAVAAERIDIGRVEKVDAALGGGIQDGAALRLVALKPEGHRAEAEPGNGKAGAAESVWCMAPSLAPGGLVSTNLGVMARSCGHTVQASRIVLAAVR